MRLILLCCLLANPVFAQQSTDQSAPESGSDERRAAVSLVPQTDAAVPSEQWMVSAANPLAAEAGAAVLRQGGNAADAMVAVQSVLGLVEPQSSGLGGGAFLVWFDAATGHLTTLDARETAPRAARTTLFQTDGQTMGFFDAVVGGLSVGTPGTPALLEEAHRLWGNHNWAQLFDSAIAHAEQGFEVSARLASAIDNDQEKLSTQPATADYFLPEGTPLSAGDTLKNPAYASTLRAIARDGAGVFYKGNIAQGIVNAVQAASQPGLLTLDDLAAYHVIEREAVCANYRGADVCGMGPPSSGALTVGQILSMLEPYNIAAMGPESADAWRLIGDASRLAFADRGLYMADEDFVPIPDLLDINYLDERATLLQREDALPSVEAGSPPWDQAALEVEWGQSWSPSRASTSHISIVDAQGNALSMTTTIENGFGSRVMAPGGFLLNNELTDFSFATQADGRPIANRVEPGKRPRSSMAPTIVLRDGKLELVVGSPGGSRIIGYVAQALIAQLDWGMDPQQAAAMPHLVNRFGTYDLEQGTAAEGLADELQALGFETNVRDLNSGLHIIAHSNGRLTGGADPRREGVVIGK